ncbi:CPCC family cysteine-rich protein [Actinoplanes lobatus]|uniref:Cysteine-rich CPCC domain-containing protein n=1 Tax=Actinoplanes lobatus TaxID=113568 RepID=A0A7W7MK81_9ACTN|nr:CPCC family cysteine-rich protein [Actinoplanes lobatus]MBB4753106.1 hypothetical protein [Actinoplanes lobatus]GIE43034.1 hypothetical protein Alo02nite_59320 [Actinoplanes lobatus]
MEAQDLERAVRTMGEVLEPLVDLDWSVTAGTLDRTCRETLAHIGHDLLAYAAQVAGRVQDAYLPLDLVIRDDASVPEVLAVVEACGGLLVAALRAAGPDTRAWHSGPCDVSGFAALGVAEVVLHTYDITQGLNVSWWIPAKFSTRVLARLAPDATVQQRQETGKRQHSTQVLLRHTGRLGDAGPRRWHITPDEQYAATEDAGAGGAPYTCPCCGHATLSERGNFEICDECWWEDDGQDNHDSAVVRGGPNGGLSLDQARVEYVRKGRGRALKPHFPPNEPR